MYWPVVFLRWSCNGFCSDFNFSIIKFGVLIHSKVIYFPVVYCASEHGNTNLRFCFKFICESDLLFNYEVVVHEAIYCGHKKL